MKLFRTVGATLLAVALTATACSNQAPNSSGDGGGKKQPSAEKQQKGSAKSQNGDLTFAVVTHGRTGDAFWDIVKTGVDQAGEDMNVQVTYGSSGDPTRQSQLIDNAIARDVDGLVVSMANPAGVRSSVERAVSEDIPVITINSGMDKSQEFGAITHVGQSEELAGEAAGKRLKEAGLKNVICVIHEQGNVGLAQRCRGAGTGLGKELTPLVVDISNIADAQNTIKSTLIADKSIDGVLTLNPVVAKAAVQAKKEANSDAVLATFDVSVDVAEAVEAGDLLFAVDQQPYLQGYLPIVMLALKNRNGNEVGGGHPVYSGPGFVTKENAAQVKRFAANGTR